MKRKGSIFSMEFKRIIKSKVYVAFVLVFLLYAASQIGLLFMFEENTIIYPNKENYMEYNVDEIKQELMRDRIGSLGYEFVKGTYNASPLGVNKTVRLNKEDTKKIESLLEFLIGQPRDEFEKWFQDYNKCRQIVIEGEGKYEIPVMKNIPPSMNESLTWDVFLEQMEQASTMIGKGSYYSRLNIDNEIENIETYDEALMDYENLIKQDKILGAVSRWLSDYLAIILGFLPVILGVFVVYEDKKYSIFEIIYVRKVSSFKIQFTRYISALLSVMQVVFLTMFIPTTIIGFQYIKQGYQVDFFSSIKYTIGWLLPTVMIALAIGFFASEVCNGAVAIILQFIWLFIEIFLTTDRLVGSVGFKIAPRFNALGKYEVFKDIYSELMLNRIFYFFLSLFIILLTTIIYDLKRRGKSFAKNRYHNMEE